MRKRSSKPAPGAEAFAGLLGLLLMLGATPAFALSTDKDQDIEVQADTAELDDLKGVSIYRGNVIVTQGTVRMTGDVMTVHHTEEDELDTLILEGNPATYRQLPDGSDVYDEAEALRMEYYELRNYVILIREAVVRQKGLRFSGERIEYDTALSQVKAWSTPAGTAAGPGAEPAQPKERVKIIIKKKESDKKGSE